MLNCKVSLKINAGDNQTMAKNFFWLHIKKSGGTSIRTILQPHYTLVDRSKKPVNFIQSKPCQYNDILNNYRVVLGEYQFKRTLFAKKFLFKEEWAQMESFAFSREPTDRVLSMYFDLFRGKFFFLKHSRKNPKLLFSNSYRFDFFLDCALEARDSSSIYTPLSLSFTTHTAPMFEDVTDDNGVILLKRIYRLENLERGVSEVFESCGITKRPKQIEVRKNKNKNRKSMPLSPLQIIKIRNIYEKDFELYENAM